MSSNDPNNQGNNSDYRGRHGDQDHRTFPTDGSRESSDDPRSSAPGSQGSAEGSRRSAEVPRTFPSNSSGSSGFSGANGSNGPARVSPPVAPSSRSNSSEQGQTPWQGQDPRQRQAPWQGQDPRQNPESNPSPVQPTRVQPPVDASTEQSAQSGYPAQSGSAGGYQGYQSQQGYQGQQGQPPQGPGAGANQSYDGAQRYGNTQRYDRSPDTGGGGHIGYSSPGTNAAHGASQTGTNSPTDPNPYGTPYAQGTGQPGTGSGPGAGAGTVAGAGPDAAAGAAGAAAYGHMGSQPNPGGYPQTGSAGFHSGPGGQGDPGDPNGPSDPYGPNGPGGPGGPYGPGPYGVEAPPRREKRGPGWFATIAIAAVAALLGGAAAFGGSYAVNAFGGEDSRKVADQTIETPDWTEVAKQTSQSVVSIQVGTNGQVQGLGSGSIYDDQGHVITNNHVVAPADTPSGEIAVTMKNGGTVKAEIVGRDPSTDIAVIKLDQVPKDAGPLPVGDSKEMKVGDPVMALGNPLGLADSVTTGIVSALDRPVSTENIGEDATSQEKEMTITNAIQTDAAINPGNSGGPLVDGDGNFIGVNSAAASLSQAGEGGQSGSIGIGFAIPSSQAVMIADQLISSGKALHPFLGITLTDGQINSGGATQGSAKVQSVQSGSPASKAGFKDGDDIVAVGGTKVNNAIALRALVRAQPTNTPVDFTVVRGGQEQTLKTTLVLK
ncbi:trypsin-like peptidase domain-containing protein [Brevibacterium zhoupengii]|uniref:trypsin-like peptidase domain-containing protein n=1 Tax=Brevibacterium zhoupengii TaxID=2898795 RepID=UPI001E5B7DA0|nr:trypsin-like peptidase domain-containing protein [Brevibacterium zhoupengii]